METNLPPRVQILEGAVDEIRQDFKEMREETRASAQRNEEHMNRLAELFTQTTNKLAEKHSEDFQQLNNGFNKVIRRLSFIAGGWVVAITVIGLIMKYDTEISNILKLLGGE